MFATTIDMDVKLQEDPRPARGNLESGTETILLIEDKAAPRERLASNLAGKGYSVFTAGDGVEGLELFQRFQSYVDLVIIDLGLPRLGGLEAARKMKSVNPGVSVILMTGNLQEDMTDEIADCGVDEVLEKPFSMKEVGFKIRSTLDRRAAKKGNEIT